MQILKTIAITSGYAGHDPQGGTRWKLLSKFVSFLSLQKYISNFFSVLEKENKKVKLEDVKKMVKEKMMMLLLLLLLFYLQKKRKN